MEPMSQLSRPVTTAELLEQMSRGMLRRHVAEHSLLSVNRGAYAKVIPSTPEERHLQLLLATAPRLGPDAVLSHATAALLHGMWAPAADLDVVHFTTNARGGGHSSKRTHRYGAPISAAETIERGPYRVTSPARTVADCLRHYGWRFGFPIGDSALRLGCRQEEISTLLDYYARRPGNEKARRLVPLLDRRSESAGESIVRGIFWQYGVPIPALQHEIRNCGVFVARSDFWWEDIRVVGEFDGEGKYVDPSMNTSPEAALAAQQVRDDRLTDMGITVWHWGWSDARHPREFAMRVNREIEQMRCGRSIRRFR